MKKYRWLNFFSLMLCSLLVFTSCGNYIDSIKNLKAGAGKQVIVLGDSIASGYGVEPNEAFPSVLSQELGLPIVNRGVSGDTTEMALKRLETDVIAAEPWLVIVELGGNDFLRKFAKAETEQNLRQIITKIQEKSAIVVILGMNLGLFTDEYKKIYQRVAEETNAYLIPESLKGILDNPRYRQQDLIHPNVEGHKLLGTRVAKELKPLLAKATWPSALMQFRSNKR